MLRQVQKLKDYWRRRSASDIRLMAAIGVIVFLLLFIVVKFLPSKDLGYEDGRRRFQGYADGIDGKLDDTVWGVPEYAKDYVRMEWNDVWERGVSEDWENPPYKNAVIDNIWNGKTPNGSGQVWEYKIEWVDECGSDGAFREDGSFCMWGRFAVYPSSETKISGPFWDAHAVPPGIVIKR